MTAIVVCDLNNNLNVLSDSELFIDLGDNYYIDFLLNTLKDVLIKNIIIYSKKDTKKLIEHFDKINVYSRWNIKVLYVPNLKSTGDALRDAYLYREINDWCLIIEGIVYTENDIVIPKNKNIHMIIYPKKSSTMSVKQNKLIKFKKEDRYKLVLCTPYILQLFVDDFDFDEIDDFLDFYKDGNVANPLNFSTELLEAKNIKTIIDYRDLILNLASYSNSPTKYYIVGKKSIKGRNCVIPNQVQIIRSVICEGSIVDSNEIIIDSIRFKDGRIINLKDYTEQINKDNETSNETNNDSIECCNDEDSNILDELEHIVRLYLENANNKIFEIDIKTMRITHHKLNNNNLIFTYITNVLLMLIKSEYISKDAIEVINLLNVIENTYGIDLSYSISSSDYEFNEDEEIPFNPQDLDSIEI